MAFGCNVNNHNDDDNSNTTPNPQAICGPGGIEARRPGVQTINAINVVATETYMDALINGELSGRGTLSQAQLRKKHLYIFDISYQPANPSTAKAGERK